MFCSVWNEFISHARSRVFNCDIHWFMDKDITHLTVYPPKFFLALELDKNENDVFW